MNKSSNLRKERWHRYQINFKLGQCDLDVPRDSSTFHCTEHVPQVMFHAGAPVDPEPRVTSRDGHVERDHVWLLLQEKWL